MSEPRRFPPPWTVEDLDACFVVRDSNGQQLAYVYFEDEPGRRSAAKLLSKDGAADRGQHRQAARTIAQGLIAKFDSTLAVSVSIRRAHVVA
jgi:hypothetical protein